MLFQIDWFQFIGQYKLEEKNKLIVLNIIDSFNTSKKKTKNNHMNSCVVYLIQS